MLLQVDPPSRATVCSHARAVPAVTGVEQQDGGLLVHVRAPYEGQLGFVLEQLRRAPGLQALRFLAS